MSSFSLSQSPFPSTPPFSNGRRSSRRAASAIPSLVQARGHRIESVPEFPLVISDSAESLEKTSAALKALKQIGAAPDADKAKESHSIRPGKGKMRNRRYIRYGGGFCHQDCRKSLVPDYDLR